MTEALGIIGQEDSSYHQLFAKWLSIAFGNKGSEAIAFTDQLAKLGRENQKNFLRYGVSFMRECCLLLADAGNLVRLPAAELETAQKMIGFRKDGTRFMNMAQAEAISAELEKAHFHVERNANPKILFLDVSLQIIKILFFKTFPQGAQYIPI
jgi:DNA polymerase-3 subunit delta'